MKCLKFRTELSADKSLWPVTHDSCLLLLGSCFSDEIGSRLTDSGFDTLVNPTGTLYNPLSIANALDAFVSDARGFVPSLVQRDGLWHSYDHHTRFSDTDKDVLLRKMAEARQAGYERVRQATHMFITFGSAYVYELCDTGRIVANCHKMPASCFNRRKLTVSEIVDRWSLSISALREINPNVKLVFTVSPIRHVADGLHGNQLSKAVLLLAVDELCGGMSGTGIDGVAYFPAYEALMDDLRDYRFYADDLVHPASMAVDYVYSLFSESYFGEETRRLCIVHEKEARRRRHRSITPV